ncbi:MAG: radical SAM protein [Lentisphaerae bacterium]|nr:MAG: radical SAM protein [Lentisphaerota bacterium]
MNILIVFPAWKKLDRQHEFHLPPHGVLCFAAQIPPEHHVTFIDDNLQEVPVEDSFDLVAISTLLTCQLPRAFQIADHFRNRKIPVIFGGIATMLHADDIQPHADSVFLGEAEGRFHTVLEDLQRGELKPRYDFMWDYPDTASIPPARREILDRSLYNYRGVQMVDLVHASRGCQFNCFPCCQGYLGGKQFRPRPIENVIAEMEAIPNNRLFIVDNSLAHNKEWLLELFRAMKPLKKKWVSHPILDDDEVLAAAAEAGAWYVYQAIFNTSDVIRNRIRRLKEHGIGIEGTIILGTDDHDEDFIKRLVDFLLEMDLDVAEFTIMTPFAHSPIRHQLEKENRIFDYDFAHYTCDRVVFQPARMSPDKLQEMYYYAWDTFYGSAGYELRMGRLFQRVIQREIEDGTFRRYEPRKPRKFLKKKASTTSVED